MADPKHLAKLKEGSTAWNRWRAENPSILPDLATAKIYREGLAGADLTGANLAKASLNESDLSWAKLRKANMNGTDLAWAKLGSADLAGANLTGANLYRVDSSEATLCDANLTGAAMVGANLHRANLSGANLSGVDLSGANLHLADLTGANLFWAHLIQANLRGARLESAALSGSDLRSANLHETVLDQTTLTDAKLWEAQRAGWSIKGVVCERVYWDENARSPTEYAPGEFERLYSEQTCIELFYEGGISTFELSTLPALLQHLSQKHEGATISLKSVEQTGGGAKVILTLGDADDTIKTQIESEATELVRTQLKLREDETPRLQIENATLKQMHETIVRMMLTEGAPQTHFHGPVGVAALPSGSATVQINQSVNDNTELIQLLEKLLTHKAEFTAAQATEIEAAKVELQKNSPDKSALSRSLDFLKTLPQEAILKGVGKLGERAASADWPNLLHQLGEFIHHLH